MKPHSLEELVARHPPEVRTLVAAARQLRFVVIHSVKRAKSGAVSALIRQALEAALSRKR